MKVIKSYGCSIGKTEYLDEEAKIENSYGKQVSSSIFVVFDEHGYPNFEAVDPQTCQEHINEMCSAGMPNAGKWVVREMVLKSERDEWRCKYKDAYRICVDICRFIGNKAKIPKFCDLQSEVLALFNEKEKLLKAGQRLHNELRQWLATESDTGSQLALDNWVAVIREEAVITRQSLPELYQEWILTKKENGQLLNKLEIQKAEIKGLKDMVENLTDIIKGENPFEPNDDACKHHFVSADNERVKGAEMCVHCHEVRQRNLSRLQNRHDAL
jgi:hypothetical protein